MQVHNSGFPAIVCAAKPIPTIASPGNTPFTSATVLCAHLPATAASKRAPFHISFLLGSPLDVVLAPNGRIATLHHSPNSVHLAHASKVGAIHLCNNIGHLAVIGPSPQHGPLRTSYYVAKTSPKHIHNYQQGCHCTGQTHQGPCCKLATCIADRSNCSRARFWSSVHRARVTRQKI